MKLQDDLNETSRKVMETDFEDNKILLARNSMCWTTPIRLGNTILAQRFNDVLISIICSALHQENITNEI